MKNWNIYECPDRSDTWTPPASYDSDNKSASGNDPYDCDDNLDPTLHCTETWVRRRHRD